MAESDKELKEIIREIILEAISEKQQNYIPYKDSISNIFSIKKNSILCEGIFRTYPIDVVIKHLCEYLNFTNDYDEYRNNLKKYSGFVCKVECDNNEYRLDFLFYDDDSNRKKIENCMNLCGYYYSTEDKFDESGKYVNVIYEKSHENKINSIVKSKKYLYHITLDRKVDKIKQQGLITKHNDKKSEHPERVYLFLDKPDFKNCEFLIKQMFGYSEIKNCSIITINSDTLKNNFYFDPNCENAVYTDEHIPKENIIKIEKIDTKNKKIV